MVCGIGPAAVSGQDARAMDRPAISGHAIDADLRRELLDMQQVDQQARRTILQNPADVRARNELIVIDRGHTARMKAIVQEHGWPGTSLVGDDGASAAWLLVQHADLDPKFQKQCLALLEAAVRRGDAEAKHWAYLLDRVRVSQNRSQVYGTQFRQSDDGGPVPQPIENAQHVDDRRKSVGLEPLAEYTRQLRELYRPIPGPGGK